ncbi:Ima1 N-terminal domain-containing protein [Cercophora samala]|uniref:Ima1 N-terminal domain-containing protein n=1 Tax=Cercophora samala TaxID=330535 RepID=A0AA40DH78_9PEZI|nr:Ima1 N-terminal domain-containing protein [Cercophora samala]
MPPRRLFGPQYLSCFYCGASSKLRNDGSRKHFRCLSCDADNYRDRAGCLLITFISNGEPVDPPVARTNTSTPAPRYAVPRPGSPPASPTNSVFCKTCLNNQRLLSASLAQYLPDSDESGDSDDEERESRFDEFRNTQERIYPQMCAECEPKVRQRLDQAAYTAKTDTLRRMMDRNSKIRRKIYIQSRMPVRILNGIGRLLWVSGFVLQLAWHASLCTTKTTQIPYSSWLPSPDLLLRWSIAASVFGMWWNPRLLDMVAGNSKQVTGLFRWYLIQCIAVVSRIYLRIAPNSANAALQKLPFQTNLQILGATVATILFLMSWQSVGLKPLLVIKPTAKQPTSKQPNQPSLRGRPVTKKTPVSSRAKPRASSAKKDTIKSLGDLLDELEHIESSPPDQQRRPGTAASTVYDLSPLRRASDEPRQPRMGFAHTLEAQQLTNSLTSIQEIDSMNLVSPSFFQDPPERQMINYSAEMEWEPAPPEQQISSHRAFSTQGQRKAQPFGAAPVEPKKGPFWYKVPPAPVTPAQRVFNPPNQPRLRPSPVQGQEIQFRGSGMPQQQLTGSQHYESAPEFPPATFFAQPGPDDPRNELTGMFSGSFSLEHESPKEEQKPQSTWLGRLRNRTPASANKKK